MEEQLQSGIALACFFLTVVICYIGVFLKGTSRKQAFIAKAKKRGHYTNGEQVSYKIRAGDYSSDIRVKRNYALKANYVYEVNGKVYHKKLKFRENGNGSFQSPQQITVYYDPANPKKAVAKNEATQGAQRSTGCLLTIVIPIIVFKVVYFLLGLV